MTILQRLRDHRGGHAAGSRQRFGHGEPEVRRTEAWEHETFAEEQARWERGDGEYAQICEDVRGAEGEEASQRADDVKAGWDAGAAPQRAASDGAERARHLNRSARAINPEPADNPDHRASSSGPSKPEVE